METLPDELLVMVCRYALCSTGGVWPEGEPPSSDGTSQVRYRHGEDIALGLIFTNRRLSRIAIPILYEENTLCFSMNLKAVMEILESLPQKNLERIKRIYIGEDNAIKAVSDLNGAPMDSFLKCLRQMSLDGFDITVPLHHLKKLCWSNMDSPPKPAMLACAVLAMFHDGLLNEIRFLERDGIQPRAWQGDSYIFGDFIIKHFVEPRLFDETTRGILQRHRRDYDEWRSGIRSHEFDTEEMQKRRWTKYTNMLETIKGIWERKGVTVENQSSYLKTRKSAIVIKRLEMPRKQGKSEKG